MWHTIDTFSYDDHVTLPVSISSESTIEPFGIRWSARDERIGRKVISLSWIPPISGLKSESASFTLTSVVEMGTVIGWIDVSFASSSVLFSSLYPFVAVLLGAVVVRLLVESVLRSFIPLVAFFVDDVVGADVGLPGRREGFVTFADGLSVVEIFVVPVVLLGEYVVDDVFGALGSVK